MGNLLQFILRGHFIDHKYLRRVINHILREKNKIALELNFGYKFLRFITVNFKHHQINYFDQGRLYYSATWLIEKEKFDKKIEMIDLSK
jgi:hypothetical protein